MRLFFRLSKGSCLCVLLVFALLFFSAIVFCGYSFAKLSSLAKPHNIYRSPYVLLERKAVTSRSPDSCCSGFIFSYRGHSFIMTAAHLYWKMIPGEFRALSETKTTFVYDAKYNFVGIANPIYIDSDRDIAVLTASHNSYHSPYGSFELLPMSVEEIEDIVGEEVYFLGACSVGYWFTDLRAILPFSERTVISRVAVTRVSDGGDRDLSSRFPMTCIFVKGSGWYGCSGGPLIYKGKVIGVCSVVEDFFPRAGTVYSSVYEVCKEFLDYIPALKED